MNRISRNLIRTFLLLLATLVAGPAAALDKVTLQLNWYHQFQFAGYYAAIEQGYYTQAGLDVRIIEATQGVDPILEVATGKSDFGVAGAKLVTTRAAGVPVVVLASIFQHSPQVMFSRKQAAALNPKDLLGKRVMLDSAADDLAAWLKKAGLPPQRLNLVAHSYDTQDLIKGKVDAMSGSLLDDAWLFDQAKFPYQASSPRDGGVDFYGDSLFTSEQMVREHGDRVRAFREASLRGWQYAMAHPEEIVGLIRAKYSQRRERGQLLFEAQQMVNLLAQDQTPLGSMDTQRWQAIAASFVESGKIKGEPNLTGFLFDPTPPPVKKASVDYTQWGMIGGGALLLVLLVFISFRLSRASYNLHIERQRQQALQEQLRISEERYRGLFTAMDNGFALNELICDSSGKPVDFRFIEVNTAFEKYSGHPRDKVLGKRANDVFQSSENDWLTQFGDVALSGKPKHLETFSQQTGRWLATDAYRPSPGKFAVVTQDITERKQMEIDLAQANEQLRVQVDEITQLQEKLREQATRDALTNLYNRRYLDETLTRELARAKRENYTLAVILIDLDFFKKVNDTYGHQAGDEVLKTFARLMLDNSRQGDVPCRYGGEEFMLMLPKMPLETAVDRANLLREKFAAITIPFGEARIRTTLSIGIAMYPLHGNSPDELTSNADQALYIAKHEGRNRAIVFNAAQDASHDPLHEADHGAHPAEVPAEVPAVVPAEVPAVVPAETHTEPPSPGHAAIPEPAAPELTLQEPTYVSRSHASPQTLDPTTEHHASQTLSSLPRLPD
jgi:diguanylate cyclase (GGDEF)-like protein/PAS domain S-box-containing protein